MCLADMAERQWRDLEAGSIHLDAHMAEQSGTGLGPRDRNVR
jgi:hypothetical protein